MGSMWKRCFVALGFVALLVLPGACGGGSSGPTGPAEGSVASLKTADWRTKIGESVELEGYLLLNDDGTGVLVDSMADTSVNAPIPETNYVALGSNFLRGLSRDTYQMAKVRLTGIVRETTDADRTTRAGLHGDLALCEIEPSATPTVTAARTGPLSALINPCVTNPGLCKIFNGGEVEKHALLYSGGINKDSAYMRYWNDMALYYNMLVWLFGYDPDNIIVVYKNGVAENGDMPVHYAATPTGLGTAFAELGANMDFNDDFFLFTTNHGGTVSDIGSPAPADEDFGADTIDECSFYYNVNQRLFDDQMASFVNGLSFGRMCCVMEQCFSGGMIYDLRGQNRVICTACSEVEVSYGGSTYDDFVMLFASALIGTHQLTGTPVDADENNDGGVSVYEAFRWATNNDTRPETPQYEDSGEGIPIAFPSAGVTIDGSYGFTYFL